MTRIPRSRGASLEELRAEASHAAQRLALYRRKVLLGRADPRRLAQLERISTAAGERLTRAREQTGAPEREGAESSPRSGDPVKQARSEEPMRGESAFRAHKAEIAKRNERACADGAARRAAREASVTARDLAAERLERSNYPRHPQS